MPRAALWKKNTTLHTAGLSRSTRTHPMWTTGDRWKNRSSRQKLKTTISTNRYNRYRFPHTHTHTHTYRLCACARARLGKRGKSARAEQLLRKIAATTCEENEMKVVLCLDTIRKPFTILLQTQFFKVYIFKTSCLLRARKNYAVLHNNEAWDLTLKKFFWTFQFRSDTLFYFTNLKIIPIILNNFPFNVQKSGINVHARSVLPSFIVKQEYTV